MFQKLFIHVSLTFVSIPEGLIQHTLYGNSSYLVKKIYSKRHSTAVKFVIFHHIINASNNARGPWKNNSRTASITIATTILCYSLASLSFLNFQRKWDLICIKRTYSKLFLFKIDIKRHISTTSRILDAVMVLNIFNCFFLPSSTFLIWLFMFLVFKFICVGYKIKHGINILMLWSSGY